MPRYLMTVCYDGSRYHGWQKQDNGISIQARMETALARMEAPQPFITAAGRTDAGVHALAQRAHFDYPLRMSENQMVKAFNSLLPTDIKVLKIVQVADDFHARFDACQRGYRYFLAKESDPFQRLYMGFIPHKPIRFQALSQYLPILLGSHDFSSFGRSNPAIPKRVCHLKELDVTDHPSHLEFRFLADRFLHNMVRRIVGTLINFAAKGLEPNELQRILREADSRQTLVETAPPQGLYLTHVGYPPEKLAPEKLAYDAPSNLYQTLSEVTNEVSNPPRNL